MLDAPTIVVAKCYRLDYWLLTDASAIYTATATGFRVYVRYANDAPLTPAQANSYGGHIN